MRAEGKLTEATTRRVEAPAVSFAPTPAAEKQFWAELHRLMASGAKRWCDVGGGARPLVPLALVEKFELEYVVLDESSEELDQAPAGYERFHASILDKQAIARLVDERGAFDVVVSRWTAEHIPDGRAFHEQVYALLRPGGTAIHFFPTLYSLPFVLNRVLPDALSGPLLSTGQPDRSKFRPYYSWCRGPSEPQIQRLQSVGFIVDRYTGYFGHGYFKRVKPLHLADKALTGRLLRHPLPSLTSFAMVALTRPS
jgi:SAM-dependent methyltransferase